jgi:hypothetical protein
MRLHLSGLEPDDPLQTVVANVPNADGVRINPFDGHPFISPSRGRSRPGPSSSALPCTSPDEEPGS